jgi:hypothetical protein
MGEAKRRREATKLGNDFAKIYRHWPEAPVAVDPENEKGGVFILSVAHDDNCPAIGTGVGCICSPLVRRFKYPSYS